MKKALVLVFADLNYDARVTRQIRWLTEKYSVTAVCFAGRTDLPQVQFEEISMTKLTLLRKLCLALTLFLKLFKLANRIQHGYYKNLKHLNDLDLVIANDVETLPLAFQLTSKDRIVFDAHEYAPRHFEDKIWWRILFAPWYHHLCKKYIPMVAAMTTVSTGLANEYETQYSRKPAITTNATRFHDLSPTEVGEPVKIIHHGIVNKSRKIEKMIEMMSYLGNGYELTLILMEPEYASEATRAYFDDLKKEGSKLPNVNFLPSLPNQKIVPTINQFDIGLFLLEPVNFNYTHALPNKLFDFVQGRLALAIGPSHEMAKIVNEFDLGVISETFDAKDLASKIRALSKKEIEKFKQSSHHYAYILSEESNKATFLNLIP